MTGDDPIQGAAVRHLIEGMIAEHEAGIAQRLAVYQPASALRAIHQALQMVEEVINLPRFGRFDDREKAMLRALPIAPIAAGDLNPVLAAHRIVNPRHGTDIGNRFGRTMIHLADVMENYRINRVEIGPDFSLASVGDAMTFLQSRRRHLVTLFYGATRLCQGDRTLDVAQAFPLLFMMAEHSCTSLTELHQNLAASYIHPDFTMRPRSGGFTASHRFDTLEADFLEPERLSLLAMQAERSDQIADVAYETVDPARSFSAAELRNAVRALRAAYQGFGVDDGAFAALSLLIMAVSRRCSDDYYVRIDRAVFHTLLAAQTGFEPDTLEALLVYRWTGLAAASNAYQPFLPDGDHLISNVNLLSRFLYAFKSLHLASRKRFQIHAGFIFEDSVKRDLAGLGFIITDIKRINRKEFDVVTLYRDRIYNFQCKNSWIDLARLDHAPERFARANRRLVTYYRAALRKERAREDLLRQRLGRPDIAHFVISRFPVITDDPAILNYNQLTARAAAIKKTADAEALAGD